MGSDCDFPFCHDDLDPQLPFLGPFQNRGARVLFQPHGHLWQVHWSALNAVELLECIRMGLLAGCLHQILLQIEYVPPEFEVEFVRAGWRPAGEFVEAWIEGLDSFRPAQAFRHPVRLMLHPDVMDVVYITNSCRSQIRSSYSTQPDWILRWAEAPNQRVYVGVDGNRPVGVIFTGLYGFDHPRGATCWIRDMVVLPTYQNRGIGRELLMMALAWGISNNARRAYLTVDVQNERAIHLYRSAGFQLRAGRGQINLQCDIA